MPAALARGSLLFGLWIVLAGVDAVDLVAGLATAACATWASLRLLPPTETRLRPFALAALVARLAWQSVAAGFDVARRVLDPKLPLLPGFVRYQPGMPRGTLRQAFAAMSSLVPGTLPAGPDGKGALLLHCLDARPEVESQLTADERRLARTLGARAGRG